MARPDGDAVHTKGWHPKSHFLVLAREYDLAQIKSHFDEQTGRFSLTAPDGLHAEGNLNTVEGRAAIAGAVAKHLGLDKSDIPQFIEAQEIGYFDTTKGPISLLNMESLREVEKLASLKLDPRRFRMNLMIEGLQAWAETLWPGKRLKIGEAVLEVTENTGRCKATHVNPDTGEADVKVLHSLKKHFGHTQLGIYAVVLEGGIINSGDGLSLLN